MTVGEVADGVVIGSKIITLIGDSKPGERGKVAYDYVQSILGNDFKPNYPKTFERNNNNQAKETKPVLEENHKYNPRSGDFGGQYVPEALHTCLAELEKGFEDAVADPEFWKEFRDLYSYIGRPSSLHKAERLSEHAGEHKSG